VAGGDLVLAGLDRGIDADHTPGAAERQGFVGAAGQEGPGKPAEDEGRSTRPRGGLLNCPLPAAVWFGQFIPMHHPTPIAASTTLALALLLGGNALQTHAGPGYKDTPMQPNGKWHVHDSDRPMAKVVAPAATFSHGAPPPADAIVLFDGKDLSKWVGGKGPATWKIENGYMEAVKGAGDIRTSAEFGDCQIHLEFATPAVVKGDSQDRGNSGVFLMGRYEIQVLDTYNNPTYADGQTGAIYSQSPPLANACKPPGEWQSYDIIWEAPRFDADGKVLKPAYVTVILNGVVLHHRKELTGNTPHRANGRYRPHPPTGPISLQDHGNPMRFRNIWVRPLGEYDQP
jgi:hypothetical protein